METLHNLGLAYDSKGDYDWAIEDYTGQPSGQACFFYLITMSRFLTNRGDRK